jgi:hypothetical protein
MNKEEARKELQGSLMWAAGIVLIALAGSYARRQGLLEPETVTRLVIGLNGLMIAWMGNRMPKAFVPQVWAQRVRRVGGWSLTLSGLIYASLFAFAPMQVAVWGGTAAVVTGIAVTLGYCISLRNKAKAKAV